MTKRTQRRIRRIEHFARFVKTILPRLTDEAYRESERCNVQIIKDPGQDREGMLLIAPGQEQVSWDALAGVESHVEAVNALVGFCNVAHCVAGTIEWEDRRHGMGKDRDPSRLLRQYTPIPLTEAAPWNTLVRLVPVANRGGGWSLWLTDNGTERPGAETWVLVEISMGSYNNAKGVLGVNPPQYIVTNNEQFFAVDLVDERDAEARCLSRPPAVSLGAGGDTFCMTLASPGRHRASSKLTPWGVTAIKAAIEAAFGG